MSKHPPQFFLSLYGWTFWVPILLTGTLAVVVACFLPQPVACIVGVTLAILTFAGLAFFRDFPRTVPTDPNIMVAPADGRVTEISHLTHYAPFNGPALKVGIFLSVLDAHVNRSPCDGIVLWSRYEEGSFLDARHPDCSAKNQSNTIALAAPDNPAIPVAVVKQIAGAIARRIIAPVTNGERLARGQRFGMIAFGSRTELYVPANGLWQVSAKLGDHVKAGKDVLLRQTHPPGLANAEISPQTTAIARSHVMSPEHEPTFPIQSFCPPFGVAYDSRSWTIMP
jgi:phosphatidylserine decarboxylase